MVSKASYGVATGQAGNVKKKWSSNLPYRNTRMVFLLFDDANIVREYP